MRRAEIAAVALLLTPAASWASLDDEQQDGQNLVTQLQSGVKGCNSFSGAEFAHIGESVMGGALGSTSLHRAMNGRMRPMMGDEGEHACTS